MIRERAQLGGGYFWYFAALGVFVPYWPLYLAGRGFDAVQIGLVMGVFAGMRIIGPPLYAERADASGRPLALLRAAGLATVACVVAFPVLHSLWAVALALAAYSVLWNGFMAVYDAHVLQRLGDDAGRYGLLRLWGSLGFIATSVLAGVWFEHAGLASLPWLLALLVGITAASLAGLPDTRAQRPAGAGAPLRAALRDPRVRAFLAVSFLMLASHGAYYNFFSLYLERFGHARATIGLLWAWAVAAEIGLFLLAPRLMPRWPLQRLMVVALVAAAVRWVALAAWPDRVAVVFAAQALHLASFGLFHLCAVALVQALFPRAAAARGQALYGSVSYGAGGLAGAWLSGWLWRELAPQAAFLAGAALALAAAWLVAARLRGLDAVPTGIREPR